MMSATEGRVISKPIISGSWWWYVVSGGWWVVGGESGRGHGVRLYVKSYKGIATALLSHAKPSGLWCEAMKPHKAMKRKRPQLGDVALFDFAVAGDDVGVP